MRERLDCLWTIEGIIRREYSYQKRKISCARRLIEEVKCLNKGTSLFLRIKYKNFSEEASKKFDVKITDEFKFTFEEFFKLICGIPEQVNIACDWVSLTFILLLK